MANGVGGAAANLLTGSVNANTQAPTIDQSGVNSDLATMGGDTASQQATLNEENAMAQGQGPSAATALLNQQTAQTTANADAMASSGSGSNGAGQARRTAMMTGANATQQEGGQAATARAQEQIGAMGAAAGQEQNMAGNQLAAAGLQGGLATSQAQIDQQNQQLQQQAQESNVKGAGNALSAAGGAISGALKFLDADFVEPAPPGSKDKNGAPPAHFTFREERGGPNHLPFMALINRTTGRARKIATEELTPSEHHQLYAPHAAGPLDSPQRKTAEMHDMSMGGGSGGASPGFGLGGGQSMDVGGALKEFSGDATSNLTQGGRAGAAGPGGPQYADGDMTQDPRFVEMVRRAHPALYRAATSTNTPTPTRWRSSAALRLAMSRQTRTRWATCPRATALAAPRRATAPTSRPSRAATRPSAARPSSPRWTRRGWPKTRTERPSWSTKGKATSCRRRRTRKM